VSKNEEPDEEPKLRSRVLMKESKDADDEE
jgi:hypothetical protein